MYPLHSGHWISKDTGSFICHITSWLLQLGPGICTKCHRQVATAQNAAVRHSNQETRAWSFTAVAWWPALADYSTAGAVQACRDCSSASTRYLANCCLSISQLSGRQHLRSASRHKLNIPRLFSLSTFGTRASQWFWTHCLIIVIHPSSLNVLGETWKCFSLPDIRDMSALQASLFQKTALHKSTFTYLLTMYNMAVASCIHHRATLLVIPMLWLQHHRN